MYDLVSRTYDLVTLCRTYDDLLSRTYDLVSRTYDLVTLSRTCDLVSRTYDLVSRTYNIKHNIFFIWQQYASVKKRSPKVSFFLTEILVKSIVIAK